MVKILNQRKSHKKSLTKRRFCKRIKFIRHSNKKEKLNISISQKSDSTEEKSNKKEKNSHIDISLINWAFIFLKQNSCPMVENNKFIQKFINIIRKLCFNKNEFILWTLYIEYYFSFNLKDSWDTETLFYIGKYAKEILGIKNCETSNEVINKEKDVEIKSVLGKKIFNLIEINKKYNYYSNFNNHKKNNYYDFNSMVEYIYNSNNYKNAKKNDNKQYKPQKHKKNDSTSTERDIKPKNEVNKYLISNHLIKFEEIDDISQKNNDDDIQENNSPNWNIDRVYEYDNSQLQDGEGEGFIKLDSSYENLNVNDVNVGGLFYINHK